MPLLPLPTLLLLLKPLLLLLLTSQMATLGLTQRLQVPALAPVLAPGPLGMLLECAKRSLCWS